MAGIGLYSFSNYHIIVIIMPQADVTNFLEDGKKEYLERKDALRKKIEEKYRSIIEAHGLSGFIDYEGLFDEMFREEPAVSVPKEKKTKVPFLYRERVPAIITKLGGSAYGHDILKELRETGVECTDKTFSVALYRLKKAGILNEKGKGRDKKYFLAKKEKHPKAPAKTNKTNILDELLSKPEDKDKKSGLLIDKYAPKTFKENRTPHEIPVVENPQERPIVGVPVDTSHQTEIRVREMTKKTAP